MREDRVLRRGRVGPRQLLRFGVLTAMLVAIVPLSGTQVEAAPDPCAEPHPVADLVVGQVVHGLTVETGTDPDPFTGEVLGVLKNALGPGNDMIVIEADSPAIAAAGGIWSGMSGSPVYAADDRLIGAVAFGLTWGSSPIAGVTPAADMYDLLGPASPHSAEGPIELSGEIVDEAVSRGSTTASDLAGGLSRLDVPLGVSGLSEERHPDLADRLADEYDVRLYSTAAASGPTSEIVADPFVPGGNAAVSMMYGDVTAAAVGTVTAVCGDNALLFGHPFGWEGVTRLGAHQAEALFVHPGGDIDAPFKVAQPGALVGTVRQDRMAGLRARVGQIPDTTVITGSASRGVQDATESTSRIVKRAFLSFGTWLHLAGHFDAAYDRAGPGTTTIEWTARGRRADGSRWFIRRHDKVLARWDASWQAADLVASTIRKLVNNGHEKITVERIRHETELLRRRDPGRVRRVERMVPGKGWKWVNPDKPLVVTAGADLRLRVKVDHKRSGFEWLPVTVKVPRRPRQEGLLSVVGGGSVHDEGHRAASNFDEVLKAVRRAPSDDDVVVTLVVDPPGDDIVERQRRVRGRDVVFGSKVVPIRVVKGN